MSAYCDYCHDGEGASVYPYYGAAPHICGWRLGKPMVGHSVTAPREEWPENFREDPEHPSTPGQYPGNGIYTHCLHCGAGDKSVEGKNDPSERAEA
jgi:hypothetical protein